MKLIDVFEPPVSDAREGGSCDLRCDPFALASKSTSRPTFETTVLSAESKETRSKDTFFLVMELVRGGDLSEYLMKKSHGHLDDKEACHVFLQIVEGLTLS